MATESALLGLAVALGSGLLIGIERERRKGRGARRAVAGVRTFTLAALAAAGAELSGHISLVVTGALLLVALTGISYWRQRSRDPGITTEIALFATYVIGVVAIGQPALASAGAVVVTALLGSRTPLHRFAIKTLSESELRDGLVFCGAALVVLPLLPDAGPAWFPAVNPRSLWGLVVLFMALQAVGYVALRVAGPRLGLALSGLASGFVSSTATIAALGARARQAPELRRACVCGALFSTVATVVLLAVVVATVNPKSLSLLGPSLIAGLIAAVAGAAWSLGPRSEGNESMAPGRAFRLSYAVGFAVLLSAVAGVVGFANQRFGGLGLLLSAGLAGFFDAHAAATSVLSVAASAGLSSSQLVIAVLLGFTTNTTSKVVAAVSAGGISYGSRVAAGLTLVAVAMWAPVLWQMP